MAHKNISVMVLVSIFQKFDHGEEIEQVKNDLGLEPGDSFYWYCGQFGSIAKVTSYVDGKFRFEKIN